MVDRIDRDDVGVIETSQRVGFSDAVARNFEHDRPMAQGRLQSQVDLGKTPSAQLGEHLEVPQAFERREVFAFGQAIAVIFE